MQVDLYNGRKMVFFWKTVFGCFIHPMVGDFRVVHQPVHVYLHASGLAVDFLFTSKFYFCFSVFARLLSQWNLSVCWLAGRRRPSAQLQSGVLLEECERCILHWTRHLPAFNTQCLNTA